jgi:hypothetical protein
MLLQEFIYFEKDSGDLKSNDRYDSDRDTSVIINKDTRKMRLTLEMLNSLRKAGDAREQETREDLELVRIMYAIPEEPTE